MSNRIDKEIELKAPVSRVWRAITDHQQFGEWFKVNIEAPFEAGKVSVWKFTHPGYENLRTEAVVKEIKPESYFSYTWHPFAIDPKVDYSHEAPTLVEFRLEPTAAGTLLKISESGFENVPEHRRAEAFKMDEGGWTSQIKNIANYVASNP